MKSLKKNVTGFLNEEHQGAETFEIVVIVAILVIIILAMFAILGPALQDKMGQVRDDVAGAGENFRPE